MTVRDKTGTAGRGTPRVPPAAAPDDHKVLVDSSDTTPDFLVPKIVAGAGIALGVLNPGGNEQLQITAAGAPPTFETVNTINTGNLGGTKLVNVDATAFPDGSLVTVFSVGATFQFVKAPSAQLIAAIDGITVVQSVFNPAWIWARLTGVVNTRFAANPPIFIDPGAGNDDNDGLLVGTALKTMAEWDRRMDGQVLTTTGFVVNCAAGNLGPGGQCRLIGTNTLATGEQTVTFVGAKSVSAPGTVSSIVAQNPATQTEFQFTDSSGIGPVIAANSRLRLTSGINAGAVGVVRGFGAGGATNPFTGPFTQSSLGIGSVFPAPTDHYVVETLLTTLQNKALEVDALGTQNIIPIWIDFLSGAPPSTVPGVAVTSNDASQSHAVQPAFIHCKFIEALTRVERPNVRFIGCEFTTPLNESVSVSGTVYYEGCVFRDTANLSGVSSLISGNCVFEGAVICQFSTVLQDDTLMSRMGAVSGWTINALGTLTLGISFLWTPVTGARNALVTGLNVQRFGNAQANSFDRFAHLSATTPVLLNQVAITAFTADKSGVCSVVCTDFANPNASVDGWQGIAPVAGASVHGGGGWTVPGERQFAKEVMFGQIGAGSTGNLSDVNGNAFFPTKPKTSYWVNIDFVMASEGNAPTVGQNFGGQLICLAHQLAAGNLVIDAAIFNGMLNPNFFTSTVVISGSASGLVITLTNNEAFAVRMVARLRWIETRASL